MIARSLLNQTGIYVALAVIISVNQNAFAQIVPDNTLSTESSVVTPNTTIRGIESDRIDGGAVRGANLFHSFEQFNIDTGRGAYFTNPSGISNIFSRVTGANRSQILGRLGVLGNANLLFINPQGIVFGSNASLDVQGSFLATTANAIRLGDVGLFSASQPATSNLLSVSPSALWFNAVSASRNSAGTAAQSIVNRSQAQSNISQPNSANLSPGLQVQPDRTLALVGGDVLLEGGRLTAAGGRIELGSVAGIGQVSLSQSGNRFVLGYDAINDFGRIGLFNGAFVDVSGARGDIQIRGDQLAMGQNSNIWADTPIGNGGEIRIRVAEATLSGSSVISADVASTGTGGNITINTERLRLREGAKVSVNTVRSGQGGNLQIMADSVEVNGLANGQTGSSSALAAESFASGSAGNLTIDTRQLRIRDGARISGSVRGAGKGGNLQITATDLVELSGVSPNVRDLSGLTTESLGSGNSGDIQIDAGGLRISDRGVINSASSGSGNASNIDMTVRDTLQANDGTIKTSAERSAGGAIDIQAGNIRLFGNSDIRSEVASGAENGCTTCTL